MHHEIVWHDQDHVVNCDIWLLLRDTLLPLHSLYAQGTVHTHREHRNQLSQVTSFLWRDRDQRTIAQQKTHSILEYTYMSSSSGTGHCTQKRWTNEFCTQSECAWIRTWKCDDSLEAAILNEPPFIFEIEWYAIYSSKIPEDLISIFHYHSITDMGRG